MYWVELLILRLANAKHMMSEKKPEEVSNAPSDIEEVDGLKAPSGAPAALEVLSGMAAGAAIGALAGPPGMLAGAVIGSAIGAAASMALDAQREEERAKDEELDETIGVIGGNIGEASPNQPPAKIGAFSVAAMGAGSAGEGEDSDGPVQNLDSD